MRIKNVLVTSIIIGVLLLFCACSSGNELKGHTFKSNFDAFTLVFSDDSNVTVDSTNLNTDRTTSVNMTYKIDGDSLYFYDEGGIERMRGAIEEEGKVVHLKEMDDGSGNFSSFDLTLYREDAKDIQESAQDSKYNEMADEINAQLGG